MAGLANPVLSLTRDSATKTVRTVATCRILFSPFELSAMEQGLQFRFRARLFGADVLTLDDNLFTFTPPKIYPDATPGSIEEARFEETLAEEVLDEKSIPDDVAGHARIARDGGLPIATGENLHTLYEFRQLIAAGGAKGMSLTAAYNRRGLAHQALGDLDRCKNIIRARQPRLGPQ